MRTVIIDEDTKGKRFDVVATEMLPMLSRAYVHVLIVGKRILLNGEQQKAGYKLRLGDVITTDFDPAEIDQIADIDWSSTNQKASSATAAAGTGTNHP